jgi:hypothetical protein
MKFGVEGIPIGFNRLVNEGAQRHIIIDPHHAGIGLFAGDNGMETALGT